ncbi:DUF4097 family beta strand repeat protein [bacterium]|nr:DUF4097 family beta strand repeat protein [bacterium]
MRRLFLVIYTSAIFLILSGLTFAKTYDFQRFFAKKVRLQKGTVIVLDNPVGEIHITNIDPNLGPFVMVKQRVYAEANELSKSRYLVMMVRLDISRRPDTLYMKAIFPTHMYEKYCYPDMGGFFTSEVSNMWHGKKFTVSPNKGVTLYSDIYLQIPAGTKISVNSIATTFVVEDYIGDIELFTDHASAMTAGDIRGNLWLTACHGNLSVGKFDGNLFYYGEDSDLSFCDVINGTVDAQSTTGDLIWTANCDSLESLELVSLSGKIMVDGGVGKICKLKNDEGDIDIKLETAVGDSLSANTSGGDIKLVAQENYAKSIFAKSDEGKVKSNIPSNDDKKLSAQLKGNNGVIELGSQRGSIKIKLISVK